MLCTTWAAAVGSTNIHQMIKASTSHPAMLFAFTSPPAGAQTLVLSPGTYASSYRFTGQC
jgi:hypothetical protein